VFQLFRRLHKESGRGVGLALCRKIIDNHKGEIKIDSKPNSGTTITILLPVLYPEKSLTKSTTGDNIHL
jgi:signal transduction histidine kinase